MGHGTGRVARCCLRRRRWHLGRRARVCRSGRCAALRRRRWLKSLTAEASGASARRVGSASGRLAHPDCSSGVVARVAETPWTGSATRDAVRRHDTVSIADARPLRRGLPSWMEAGLLITQRSRVQIPSPLPRPEVLYRTEKGLSAYGLKRTSARRRLPGDTPAWARRLTPLSSRSGCPAIINIDRILAGPSRSNGPSCRSTLPTRHCDGGQALPSPRGQPDTRPGREVRALLIVSNGTAR